MIQLRPTTIDLYMADKGLFQGCFCVTYRLLFFPLRDDLVEVLRRGEVYRRE